MCVPVSIAYTPPTNFAEVELPLGISDHVLQSETDNQEMLGDIRTCGDGQASEISEYNSSAVQTTTSHHQIQDKETLKLHSFKHIRHPAALSTKEVVLECIDVILQQREHGAKKINHINKINLFIFYLVYFILQVTVLSIDGKHLAHNIVSSIISLSGVLIVMSCSLYCATKHWKKSQSKALHCSIEEACEIPPRTFQEVTPPRTFQEVTSPRTFQVVTPPRASQEVTVNGEDTSACTVSVISDVTVTTNDHNEHGALPLMKHIGKIFITDLTGILLLYPSVICNLYGFVNEQSWEFGNTSAIVYCVTFIYSVVMDAIYTKIIYVWVLQRIIKRILHGFSCRKIIYLLGYFALPSILTHWIILAIIGVRIYVDNFSTTLTTANNLSEPANKSELGNYMSTPFTGYMIFCGAYLPIVSIITYFILNRYQFLRTLRSIKNENKDIPHSAKIWADPYSYFAVTFLMVPFIPFAIGSFLPDYNSSDFALASSVETSAQSLGACFITLFLLSNLQATILSASLIVIIPVRLITLIRTRVASCKPAFNTSEGVMLSPVQATELGAGTFLPEQETEFSLWTATPVQTELISPLYETQ